MGLPVFITPVEPSVAAKAAEKVAAPRSSIRRQRTVPGGIQARTAELRRRRIQETLENEIPRSRTAALERAAIVSLQARSSSRFSEYERAALSEPTSWERRTATVSLRDLESTVLPAAPDPAQEARLREQTLDRLDRNRLRRIARRRTAPTPPYSQDSPRTSSLTPALSPLRMTHPEEETDDLNDFAARVANREARFRALREDQHEAADGMRTDRTRALNDETERAASGYSHSGFRGYLHDETERAVTGRSHSSFREYLIRRNRLDGLGDRERSPERAEAWDTLLTGITPDPQPPSAESSFASSSAAAAATSSSNAHASSAWVSPATTSLERSGTTPSLRDCDEPSSSDSNTEDEDEQLIDLYTRSSGRVPYTSSYADVARPSRGAQSPDESLEGMARIVRRLANRDDIPESWWASVGLRRENS